MKNKSRKLFFLLLSLILVGSGQSYAQALSYDRYAPVYKETPAAPSVIKQVATEILTYPLEPFRYLVDKTLYGIEEYAIDKKAIWIYDTIKNQGFYPSFGFSNFSEPSAGLEVDLVRIARLKHQFPDVTFRTGVQYVGDVYLRTVSKLGQEGIFGTPFDVLTSFKYEDRKAEHFHGVGPNTSRGEGGVFSMETTEIRTDIGYRASELSDFDFNVAYQNINISNGRDGGRKQIRDLFGPNAITGSNGDSLFSLGLQYTHDTRDHKSYTTRGGVRRVGVSYFEGLSSSDARFFRYETEFTQFIPLGSPRRILAIRLYGQHNDEFNGGNVPFHQMAKLGGYGDSKRLSETMRGYDFNRFFDDSALLLNIEYRYTIWEYRDFRMDSVLFWDEGQVFSDFGNFQFEDFKESYGLGFRLSLANMTIVALEIAHGDEGTNFYVKSETPF